MKRDYRLKLALKSKLGNNRQKFIILQKQVAKEKLIFLFKWLMKQEAILKEYGII